MLPTATTTAASATAWNRTGVRLAASPPPVIENAVVATYFFAFRSVKLEHAVEEISYHATSGVKHPPKGSLLEACSAKAAGVDAFDATGRLGLLHVAFPLKMLLQPDGHVTSCDLLHTIAAAVIFDVYERKVAEPAQRLLETKIASQGHVQKDHNRRRHIGRKVLEDLCKRLMATRRGANNDQVCDPARGRPLLALESFS